MPSANQAPIGGGEVITLLEDGYHQFQASEFHFSDPNDSPGHDFQNVQIRALPANGTLLHGTTVVQAWDLISVADINAGLLKFVPDADESGIDGFAFAVQDNGGIEEGGQDTSGEYVMTLDVIPVNDAPDFTGSDSIFDEDAGAVTIPYWATFAHGGGFSEQLQTAIYFVSNISNPSLFTQAPAVDALGNLTFTIADNANGTATFDIQVQDDGGTDNGGGDLSSVQTFAITVNPVNDAPDLTGSDVTVDEDAGIVTISSWATFNPGTSAESSQSPTYLIENISNPSLFDFWPSVDSAGNLTFTLAPDASGSSTFDIMVQDDGGISNGGVDLSSVHTFTITANPINDAPTFTAQDPYAVYDNAGAVSYSEWAIFSPGGGADEASQTPTYVVSNVSDPNLFDVLPAVASDGTLTYTVKADTIGDSTFDVTVQDSGGTTSGGQDTSAAQTFVISVESVQGAAPVLFNTDRSDRVIPARNATLNLPGGSKTVIVRVGANPLTLTLTRTLGAEGTAYFDPARTMQQRNLAAGATFLVPIYGGDGSSVARNIRLSATIAGGNVVDLWDFSVFYVTTETITTGTLNAALMPDSVVNSAGTVIRTAAINGSMRFHDQLGFQFFNDTDARPIAYGGIVFRGKISVPGINPEDFNIAANTPGDRNTGFNWDRRVTRRTYLNGALESDIVNGAPLAVANFTDNDDDLDKDLRPGADLAGDNFRYIWTIDNPRMWPAVVTNNGDVARVRVNFSQIAYYGGFQVSPTLLWNFRASAINPVGAEQTFRIESTHAGDNGLSVGNHESMTISLAPTTVPNFTVTAINPARLQANQWNVPFTIQGTQLNSAALNLMQVYLVREVAGPASVVPYVIQIPITNRTATTITGSIDTPIAQGNRIKTACPSCAIGLILSSG